jgi:hypothetical protein
MFSHAVRVGRPTLFTIAHCGTNAPALVAKELSMKRHRYYAVGYGRPPLHTQFKAGQSGNPKGKPKGRKKMGTLFQEALSKRISIRQGEAVRKVSRAEAMILALFSKALKGDAKACATLIAFAQQSGEFKPDPQPFSRIERVVYPDGREEKC